MTLTNLPVKVCMLGTHFRGMSIFLILVSTYRNLEQKIVIAWLRVRGFFGFRESSPDEVRFSLKVYISSVQNS